MSKGRRDIGLVIQAIWVLQIVLHGLRIPQEMELYQEYKYLEQEAARADQIMVRALEQKWKREEIERQFKSAGATLQTFPNSFIAEWEESGWIRQQYVSIDKAGNIARFRWWYEDDQS